MYYILLVAIFFYIKVTDASWSRVVARNTYRRTYYKIYQAFTVSSQNSTVLSLSGKANKQFDFASKTEILVTFPKIITFGALCLCLAHGHTHTPETILVCMRTHIHTPSDFWLLQPKGRPGSEGKKNPLINTNPTSYGNISNPKGPPPSIKPVQSSSACKVWLNPSMRLNHRPPGQTIKHDDSDHSLTV